MDSILIASHILLYDLSVKTIWQLSKGCQYLRKKLSFNKGFIMNFMHRMITAIVVGLTLAAGWYTSKRHQISANHSLVVDIQSVLQQENIIPIAVIGSGPAGLSAALYGARENIYTVVFNGSQPGGQLTTTAYVENWPGTEKALGADLMTRTQKQAEHFGAIMVYDSITRVDFSSWPFTLYTDEGKVVKALTVVLATGASSRKLGVPGEDAYSGGKGVTSCAVCDAPYFKDKKVVVVGGGDSAVEEAIILASFAKEVTILVRGDKMRAAPAMFQRLGHYKNIKIVYHTAITQITGNDEEVTGIDLVTTNAQNNEKVTSKMAIDGVFLAVGHIPNTTMFKEYVSVDEHGYIVLGKRSQQTSLAGIYSAGDVSDPHYKQAGVAAGDGIKAGMDAIAFLRDNGYNDAFAAKIEKQLYDPYADRQTLDLKKIASQQDFDAFLKEHQEVTVVDFYAPWCASCKHMLPIVETVAARFEGKATFVKVDVAEAKEIAESLKVKNVPWLLVFKDGKEVARTNQIMSKRQLSTYVSQFIY